MTDGRRQNRQSNRSLYWVSCCKNCTIMQPCAHRRPQIFFQDKAASHFYPIFSRLILLYQFSLLISTRCLSPPFSSGFEKISDCGLKTVCPFAPYPSLGQWQCNLLSLYGWSNGYHASVQQLVRIKHNIFTEFCSFRRSLLPVHSCSIISWHYAIIRLLAYYAAWPMITLLLSWQRIMLNFDLLRSIVYRLNSDTKSAFLRIPISNTWHICYFFFVFGLVLCIWQYLFIWYPRTIYSSQTNPVAVGRCDNHKTVCIARNPKHSIGNTRHKYSSLEAIHCRCRIILGGLTDPFRFFEALNGEPGVWLVVTVYWALNVRGDW